ncbi:hypothetical protein ARZXY2_1485 [Arthrobacter sp. ZXY-2]|nr:hypothetical protein ARZXY2_1485 [Arthrobacter sp. ZXY-2]
MSNELQAKIDAIKGKAVKVTVKTEVERLEEELAEAKRQELHSKQQEAMKALGINLPTENIHTLVPKLALAIYELQQDKDAA